MSHGFSAAGVRDFLSEELDSLCTGVLVAAPTCLSPWRGAVIDEVRTAECQRRGFWDAERCGVGARVRHKQSLLATASALSHFSP